MEFADFSVCLPHNCSLPIEKLNMIMGIAYLVRSLVVALVAAAPVAVVSFVRDSRPRNSFGSALVKVPEAVAAAEWTHADFAVGVESYLYSLAYYG